MEVDVYFATNRTEPRQPGGSFGRRFNSDGPHFYEVGHAQVTFREVVDGHIQDPDAAEVKWTVVEGSRPEDEEVREASPELHRKLSEGEKTGSSVVFDSLRTKMSEDQRDAIVFIHGFANSFESALIRAADLKVRYQIQPRDGEAYQPHMFCFSWPSDGAIQPPWKYASDRDDAAQSGLAMARALRRFVDFLESGDERCERRIHLVAHSMGNWALRHALLGFRALLDGGRLQKLFDNVFLMCADEDDDALGDDSKLGLLTQVARHVHVYHASTDLALEVSDKTKFNMDRLGSDGPKTFSGLSTRIVAVDCRDVASTAAAHVSHQYYRLRTEVIDDVRHVLTGRLRPDQIPGRHIVEPGRRYRIAAV